MVRQLKDSGRKYLYALLSRRTWMLFKFDLVRLRTRLSHWGQRNVLPKQNQLHFGCGKSHVVGWLNVDVLGSDYNVDLASGALPWRDNQFVAMVGLQVIEHLELTHELLPMLKELWRVAAKGGEIWLSCPDMEKVCRSYVENKGADLVQDRQTRWSNFSLAGLPTQQIVNVLFHQNGEHKNLYDFELLQWALAQAGFVACQRVCEADFNRRFPEFPLRGDDYNSLYVRAQAA